jgi:hypothetical protein
LGRLRWKPPSYSRRASGSVEDIAVAARPVLPALLVDATRRAGCDPAAEPLDGDG